MSASAGGLGQGVGSAHGAVDRGGFALALVVLMLFAIGAAAAATYEVVSTEFLEATANRQSVTALTVARAGLQEYLAEQIGAVSDSSSYAIGDGVATVTARRVLEVDSLTYLYYIRSDGEVIDPRTPSSPALRSVATYAYLHESPLKPKAAMMLAATQVTYQYGWTSADGTDHAATGDCAGTGTYGVAGSVAAGDTKAQYSASVRGNPDSKKYSSRTAVIDSAGVRWDILSNPNFPVEFDGSPPSWGSIPSDSFPVVRYDGNLSATSTWSGHGVLVVTGRLTMGWGFRWQGIILAGSVANVGWNFPYVQGTVVGGLNGTDGDITFSSGTFCYNSSYVYAADKSLSYLDVVDKTMFEVNR